MTTFLAGAAVALVAAVVGFVFVNRKHSARLDEIEQKVRDFKPSKK